MADDEVKIEDSVPIFESIETLQTRSISTPTVNVEDDDDIDVPDSVVVDSIPISPTETGTLPRRRGRPKGSKNRPRDSSGIPIPATVETKLTGRVAKDVSFRGQQVLTGATRIPALWKPHIQMSDEEAQNIADPLASYATRKAEESTALAGFIKNSLDNFDLVAAGIGITSYVIRVIKDENELRQLQSDVRQQYRTDEAPRARVDNSRRANQEDRPVERARQETTSPISNGQPASIHNEAFQFVSTPALGEL